AASLAYSNLSTDLPTIFVDSFSLETYVSQHRRNALAEATCVEEVGDRPWRQEGWRQAQAGWLGLATNGGCQLGGIVPSKPMRRVNNRNPPRNTASLIIRTSTVHLAMRRAQQAQRTPPQGLGSRRIVGR